MNILPCPFCGSKAEVVHHDWHGEYSVECTGCRASMGLMDDGETHRAMDTEVEAVKAWNKRV